MGRLTLITGGARAGKTTFAHTLAAARGGPVTYVATAEAGDDEMAARIRAHQAERPPHWRTVEAPLQPAAALVGATGVVVLDCLTLWVSNLMFQALGERELTNERQQAARMAIEAALAELLAARASTAADLVVVTNEVGLGIVPGDPLSRLYRDLLGRANQRVAAAAGAVYLVVAGLAVELRALGATPVERRAGASV